MKKISFFIFFALMLSFAASCSDSAKKTEPLHIDSTETASEEETEESPDFLPDDIDYNGDVFKFLHGQDIHPGVSLQEIKYEIGEFETGDIISDAIYRRTQMTEEKLNINVESRHVTWSELYETVEKSILASDQEFDAVCGRLSVLSQTVFNGWMSNLKDIKTLDLSNSWWDDNIQTLNIYNAQYITSGDLNYLDDYAVSVMMFNKELFNDRQIEEPYPFVLDGKWTFEEFYKIINDTDQDLNGDGVMDEYDFYGFVINYGFLSSCMQAFGEMLTLEDDSGNVIVNQGQSIIDKAQYVADRLMDNPAVLVEERKLGYKKGDKLFPQGQALMLLGLVGSIHDFRQDMEKDFGVLPMPKYDEMQEGYHSPISQHWASAISIPITCSDFDRCGYLLDTMGYYSPDTITNAIIEKNIYIKSLRDEMSEKMLNIVFSNKIYNPSVVYDWGVYGMWMGLTGSKHPKFTSTMDKKSKKINKTIADFYESVSENLDLR